MLSLGQVDIEDSPKTAKRFGVQEVPELRLFRDRSVVQYAGTWDVEDIQLFIQVSWHRVDFLLWFATQLQIVPCVVLNRRSSSHICLIDLI